jgi:flagellar biosynthesis/type III secretory pathway M-ring protein FliF/YscJ
MSVNWLILVPVIVVVAVIAVLLVIQNQKDEKELEKKIIEEDEIAIKEESDNENEPVV